ncbi:MAG: hypothetical protein HY704_05295 [Gemmatimonadetes bacterium]|nr:hypothetical protein [Gemmatimonadota bacterium]
MLALLLILLLRATIPAFPLVAQQPTWVDSLVPMDRFEQSELLDRYGATVTSLSVEGDGRLSLVVTRTSGFVTWDGGRSWRSVEFQGDPARFRLGPVGLNDLALGDDGSVWAATDEGLTVSRDSAASWSPVDHSAVTSRSLAVQAVERLPSGAFVARAGRWLLRIDGNGSRVQAIDLSWAWDMGLRRIVRWDALALGPAGTVHAVTHAGQLVVFDAEARSGRVVLEPPDVGRAAGELDFRLAVGPGGNVHLGTRVGLYRLDAGRGKWRRVRIPGADDAWIGAVHTDPAGALYIAARDLETGCSTVHVRPASGIFRRWRRIADRCEVVNVRALVAGPDGLWIGSRGLLHARRAPAGSFDAPAAIPEERAPDLPLGQRERVDLHTSDDEASRYFVQLVGDGSGAVGHAFVVWGREDASENMSVFDGAYGLWPRTSVSWTEAVFGTVPAEIYEEFGIDGTGGGTPGGIARTMDLITVRVDRDVYERSRRVLRARQRDVGGNYQLLVRDCVTFLREVADVLGLELPYRMFAWRPTGYVQQMIARLRTEDRGWHPQSGLVYVGQTIRGVPHGRGEISRTSGLRYSGQLRHGIPDGDGAAEYENGDRYTGTFRRGSPHGSGEYRWASGHRYEGEIVSGRAHGTGTFAWANGSSYRGTVSEGLPHGTGTFHWPDGSRFEGTFAEGQPHGRGVTRFSGGARYEGEVRNGREQGQGTFHWPDGSRFEGTFAEGKPRSGTYVAPNGTRHAAAADGSGRIRWSVPAADRTGSRGERETDGRLDRPGGPADRGRARDAGGCGSCEMQDIDVVGEWRGGRP